MRRYFGTDGIRGVANEDLTPDIAYKCGNALTRLTSSVKVVIGRDTRGSGDMLALAVASGILAGGGDVVDMGVIPTAAVAYLTRATFSDYGVVISASHNPSEYNGIKIFDKRGYKLLEEEEERVEECFKAPCLASHPDFGKYEQDNHGAELYADYLARASGASLRGFKVVLDCSNGASYKIAPELFARMGAKVFALSCGSNGANINDNCGSLHPEELCKKVVDYGADVGFAFDGDSDRVVGVDEKGRLLDGDMLIYILAKRFKTEGILEGNMVVGTHHTNMAVQNSLAAMGIKLLRSDIGDKYVLEMMLSKGCSLGGEQSGHIIMSALGTTGDGVLAALKVSETVIASGKRISELADLPLFPQTNISIVVKDKIRVMNNEELAELIDSYRKQLAETGRILVRASGTEPKIRIMVECVDADKAKTIAEALAEKVKAI